MMDLTATHGPGTFWLETPAQAAQELRPERPGPFPRDAVLTGRQSPGHAGN